MDPIPISFKHNGIKYTDCYFTKVVRANDTAIWHLHDNDNYYLGRLRFTDQWIFDANQRKTGIEQLAEFFGDFVKKTNGNDSSFIFR
jgi:hypothetical protein